MKHVLPDAEALRQMAMPREGGKYPTPTVGDRALSLYREIHAAACETQALPPFAAVLVIEYDAAGRLIVRTEPLKPDGLPTDK